MRRLILPLAMSVAFFGCAGKDLRVNIVPGNHISVIYGSRPYADYTIGVHNDVAQISYMESDKRSGARRYYIDIANSGGELDFVFVSNERTREELAIVAKDVYKGPGMNGFYNKNAKELVVDRGSDEFLKHKEAFEKMKNKARRMKAIGWGATIA